MFGVHRIVRNSSSVIIVVSLLSMKNNGTSLGSLCVKCIVFSFVISAPMQIALKKVYLQNNLYISN